MFFICGKNSLLQDQVAIASLVVVVVLGAMLVFIKNIIIMYNCGSCYKNKDAPTDCCKLKATTEKAAATSHHQPSTLTLRSHIIHSLVLAIWA